MYVSSKPFEKIYKCLTVQSCHFVKFWKKSVIQSWQMFDRYNIWTVLHQTNWLYMYAHRKNGILNFEIMLIFYILEKGIQNLYNASIKIRYLISRNYWQSMNILQYLYDLGLPIALVLWDPVSIIYVLCWGCLSELSK